MFKTLEELKERAFSKYKKDTWEIKTIGEIATDIYSGSEITVAQLDTGDHPAIRFNEIFNSEISIEECQRFVNPDLVKRKKYANPGDILMATTSNTGEYIGKVCVYLGKNRCLVGNDIKIIKHNQNPKFLSYVFSSRFLKKQIEKLAQESTVFHLYENDIRKIKIPLPSLEIQQEIVEFLDKFIELERELERELEERKKQYEYFKNLVFNRGIEELNWEMRTIEQIAIEKMYRGIGASKDQLGTGNHPAIKCGDINTSLPLVFTECVSFVNEDLLEKKKYFEHGNILMGAIGDSESAGKAVAYLGKEKCLLGNMVYVLKHKQNPKYLAFVLSGDFVRKQIKKLTQKSTVSVLYLKDLKQIKIPLPPLEIQEEIVEKLDKFYRIVNDLEEGIPALIMDNRRQYEGFREKIFEI